MTFLKFAATATFFIALSVAQVHASPVMQKEDHKIEASRGISCKGKTDEKCGRRTKACKKDKDLANWLDCGEGMVWN